MEDKETKIGKKEIQNIKMTTLEKENILKSILNNTIPITTKPIKSPYSFASIFSSPIFYTLATFCLILILSGGYGFLNQKGKNTDSNLATTQGTTGTNTQTYINQNTNRQIAKNIPSASQGSNQNTPSVLSMPKTNGQSATMMAPRFNPEIITGLKKAFELYRNGQILECTEKGEIYYSASLNAYDGQGQTFDINGKIVGEYQGFTGGYTGIHPENCELIYVVSPNIWGLQAINKYNLK